MPRLRPSRCWLVAAMLCMALTGCTPKFVALTRQGDLLLQKENYEGARKRYEAALKANPKYPPALYKLGWLSLQAGRWEEAVLSLTNALVADPQFPQAYRDRGIAELHLSQLESAGKDLQKAAELGAKRTGLPLASYRYLAGAHDQAFSALSEPLQSEDEGLEAAKLVLVNAIASGDLKRGRELLLQAKVPAEAADDLARIQADLAYLDKDWPAALEAAGRGQDRLNVGIWYRDPSPILRKQLGSLGGVVVEYLHLGSPAAEVGIQPGDIIISFERKAVSSAEQLDGALEAFRRRPTHEEALFEVRRGDQHLAFKVTPGDFKTKARIEQTASGADLVALTVAQKEHLDFP